VYCTVLGQEQYVLRDDTVCVELYCTVLVQELYVQKDDTLCAELYCNMIQCVLKCTVECWARNSM